MDTLQAKENINYKTLKESIYIYILQESKLQIDITKPLSHSLHLVEAETTDDTLRSSMTLETVIKVEEQNNVRT